ncbi:MAG: M28 family peptidase [Chitinophagales bacterium]|nr:M28 family peptidase [Chitinophagales bacterium]MBP9704929.1 M28 family peptidase [Chitinophagales bacterium]
MKKLLFLICSFYIAIFSVSAQERLADPRLQFANTITAAELKTHLSIIASDEYEGRGTATKGQQMAAEYISNYYKSIGIPPLPGTDSYYQKFELMEIGLGDMQLNIGKEKYQFIRDFYAFPNSSNSADIQSTEIIFLGYGIDDSAYSDYKNIDVAGKVIVVLQGEPKQNEKSLITGSDELSEWSTEWDKKIETATQHQVKCIFIIDEEIERVASSKYFVNYLTSSSLKLKKDYTPSPFCAYAFIAPHVGDELLDGKKLSKAKTEMQNTLTSVSYTTKNKLHFIVEKNVNVKETENVLGYIEGGELKEELVIVSAHYDHLGIEDGVVYNGADDDGSGTVGLLEIADALMQAKNAGYPLKRSVLFLSFTGEELGLYGSEYYTDNPVFPLENTVADLNIDMIGRVDDAHIADSNYIYIIGSDFLSKELHEINAYNAKTYTNLNLDYTFNTTDDPNKFYYRSDHYNFAKNNIPIIFFFNGVHADYHKPTDDIEKIHFPLLAERVLLVYHDLWSIANMERRIKVDAKE